MKVTYIFHSCFLVETQTCYCLFDYWQGLLPALDRDKPVFVFVSHSHRDHYNPEVFALLTGMGMKQICGVLPNDIPKKRYPALLRPADPAAVRLTAADFKTADSEAGAPGSIPALRVLHSREYDLPGELHVRTLLSTDSGVAYLLACPEGVVFHAGDLNDWSSPDTPDQKRRQMTGSYRASIDRIKGTVIDVAFFPLDPRLGACYADGLLYFLKTVRVRRVFPMHYWEQPEIVERFLAEYPQYSTVMSPLT